MSEENKFQNIESNETELSRADSGGVTSGTGELSEIQPLEKRETAVAEKDKLKAPQGNSTQNFIAFLVFVGIIAVLFLSSKANWERKLKTSEIQIDSLLNHSKDLEARMGFMQKVESSRIKSIIGNEFDSFDAGNYRVYGLYRDASKKLNREQLSNRFNVYNAGAIQYSEVVGERWFAIPVKGIHFMQRDETLEEIAEKYYGNVKDTSLISAFNNRIEPYRNIFIPFGN
jgi:hypothetical protein